MCEDGPNRRATRQIQSWPGYIHITQQSICSDHILECFGEMCSWHAATSPHNAGAKCEPILAPWTCLNRCRPTMKHEFRRRKATIAGRWTKLTSVVRLPARRYWPRKIRWADLRSWSWKVIVLSRDTLYLWQYTCNAYQTLSTIRECGTELKKNW